MPSLIGLTGTSQAVRDIQDQITSFAALDVGILLTGEAGVGKQRLARCIHERSHRSDEPFVVTDGAADDGVFESEWLARFVSIDSSYRRGLRGGGGTLLIRNVDTMALRQQAALFRFLDALNGVTAPGHRRPLRVIAAARSDVFQAVETGRFRHDLFYRLNVVHIGVPPLRDRPEDVPVLFEQFAREIAEVQRCRPPAVAAHTLHRLATYSWPQNVRELKLVTKQLVVRGGGGLERRKTPARIESL